MQSPRPSMCAYLCSVYLTRRLRDASSKWYVCNASSKNLSSGLTTKLPLAINALLVLSVSVTNGLLFLVLTTVKPYFSIIVLSVTPNGLVVSRLVCAPLISIILLILRLGKSIRMACAMPSVLQSGIA